MSANKRPRPGFTLVELLTVVVLIGILFSISFQSFANARDRSTNAQVDGNVRAIAQALINYEADNDRFPHALSRVPAAGPGLANPADLVLLDETLDRRYLPGNKMLRTPWTECWQGNNMVVPLTDKAKGLWKVNAAAAVTDVVKVPANPVPISTDGKLPTDGGAPRAVLFTTATFGAILYETNAPARNKFMLVGVGKARGDARVVALSTNVN